MISTEVLPHRATFVFPGDIASVASSRDQIMEWVAPYCLDEACHFDLLIAVQEALANAALHGCAGDHERQIQCFAEADPAAIVITVRDPGPGFDVSNIADPQKYQSTTLEHGRGIPLMRSLVDDLAFARNGSEVRLTKKIKKA